MLFKNRKFLLLFLIVIFGFILRFAFLSKIPPSLYSDEINQGYNAYSVLKTAKDEHGVFLPVSFRSFGDFKPPLPTYIMIPFIAVFGLSEISIRLPSVILGCLSIVITYFLVFELLKKSKNRIKVALLTSFLISISPWHVLQSRAAMLVIVSLVFLQFGVYCFLKAQNKPKLLLFSSISFVLSIYSYYGMRLITPLAVLALFLIYKKKIAKHSKEIIVSFLLSVILLMPLFLAFLNSPDVVFGRAKSVSVFFDKGIKLRQWELFSQDGLKLNTNISRFFHNKVYMYTRNIIQRFLSHFEPDFLFLTGDQSPPFQIPNMGVLYFLDAVFILSGFLVLRKLPKETIYIIAVWTLAAVLPAAFTYMTPSANRTFNVIFPLSILTALGVGKLTSSDFFRPAAVNYGSKLFISFIYSTCFLYFCYQYFLVLPVFHADWWNWGFKHLVKKAEIYQDNYENIVVPDLFGMPYIYFLFYLNYPPEKYQNEAIRSYVADNFGYEHVEGFGKYLFPQEFDWEMQKDNLMPNSIYILPSRLFAAGEVEYDIKYPDKKDAFKIIFNE